MPKIKRGKAEHPNMTPNVRDGKQISYRVILELHREKVSPTNNGNVLCLWVVHWSNSPVPVLEKRRLYTRTDGTTRTYKQAGLTLADLSIIAQRQDDVIKALQSP